MSYGTKTLSGVYYNPQSLGAFGTGTDNTVALQETIYECAGSGGGHIVIAPGTYVLSSPLIIPSDNVQFVGCGWGTIFSAAVGFPSGPIIKVLAPGGAGNFRYGIKFADFMINGNNQPGVGGIELDSTYGALLDHVRVRFCPGTGLFITDPSSGAARGAYTKVRDSWFTDGGAGTAILSSFAENWTMDGGLIAFYNTAGGIGIKNQDGGCIITHVQFDMCDTSFIQAFVGSSQFIGNNCGRAVSRHVYLNGAKRTVVANNYFDMATGTPSPAAIIYADNASNASNVIANNACIGLGNGWTFGYFEAGGIGTPGNTLVGNNWNGLSVQSFDSHTNQLTVSVNTPDPGNNGTIQTSTGVTGDVTRVNPGANETGWILEAGAYNGQHCVVENIASNSGAFAAAATSHVASGAGQTVLGLTCSLYIWDSAQALWYKEV